MSSGAEPAAAQPGADPPAPVDARNPYLGLVSFTEETREYFYGRDEEVAELARRVQRKLLTVLFGKSGLGKTSILRAGLLPKLRRVGYCPVYVRIAYGPDSPEPAEQIKAAIGRAASVSGQWTQAGVAADGESLWEFLHHRDDVLRDAAGAPLLPLIIFDQFEELFTLAQSDEFGRARARNFIEELADLVENRPPQAFEARLDVDDSAAERFDFARSDYRVLIALREDYLASLESLRQVMPSLLQNRVRLTPMTSVQALEAVRRPGGHLVSETTAQAIVRFVAGGSERDDAPVEPSLLSLICRELNDARLAQDREEISLDLLAGSHQSILVNFYERSLADQPAGVRRVIEDELLTDSGFRENVAEERLLKHFQAAGAAPGALSSLVNRRLLRIEERLDVRRVELTHDVLCGVVKASRDQRQEREARETAERVLEEQRERERAARHALRRARAVALGCILLAVLALSAAGYAYVNAERAQRAERLAQQNRTLAEQARNHAEHLLGYLADDFERQLESFGQLKLIAEFTQRQIDYFHSLPPELRSPETVRYGALALIEHAETLRELGDYDTGIHNLREAMGLLSQLQRAHPSAATEIALGRADTARCLIVTVRDPTRGLSACHQAVALLRPLAARPGASVPARQAYLEALTGLGWAEQNFGVDYQGAERVTREAMRIADALGAEDFRQLQISADYAFAGAWRVNALVNLDRNQEALRVGKTVLAVTDGVLARRPWYRLTLNAKEITESTLAQAAGDELDPQASEQFGLAEFDSAQAILRLDPKNVDMRNNLGLAITDVCVPLWAHGQLRAALGWCHKALDAWARVSRSLSGGFVVQMRYVAARTAEWQAVAGDLQGAVRTAQSIAQLSAAHPRSGASVGGGWFGLPLDAQAVAAEVAYERGDFAAASHLAQRAIQRLTGAKVHHAGTLARAYLLYAFARVDGHAEYQLGHFAAAAAAARLALDQAKIVAPFSSSVLASERARARISALLAMALARQGKPQQAAQVIDPVVTFEDGLLQRNHGDVWVPYELAGALYAQSLCDPLERAHLRARAAALLEQLPPALKALRDVRRLRHSVAGSGPAARELPPARHPPRRTAGRDRSAAPSALPARTARSSAKGRETARAG